MGPGAGRLGLFTRAVETLPARELLLLKCLCEVLRPGPRENLLRSSETRAYDWGWGGWKGETRQGQAPALPAARRGYF